ncbi:unnamed protein product [Polarella glacialis]|uniref:EF-hand domain-containing protein n=1 Tax=Polarella glacialis TaxID=89957 RepID=A0A813LL36_POLGL|nr:unnamed protein product [Polarella glacialis]
MRQRSPFAFFVRSEFFELLLVLCCCSCCCCCGTLPERASPDVIFRSRLQPDTGEEEVLDYEDMVTKCVERHVGDNGKWRSGMRNQDTTPQGNERRSKIQSFEELCSESLGSGTLGRAQGSELMSRTCKRKRLDRTTPSTELDGCPLRGKSWTARHEGFILQRAVLGSLPDGGAVHEASNMVSRGPLAVDAQDADAQSSHWQIERAELRQLLGEVLQQEFRELSAKLMKETLPEEFRRLAATCFADGPGSPGTAAGTFRAFAAGTASGTSGASAGGPECAALPCSLTSLIEAHCAQPDASLHSPRPSLSMRLAPKLSARRNISGQMIPAGFRPSARRLVKTAFFDYCISGVLVLNAVSIGVQAEYQARLGSAPESSAYFQYIEGVFGFIFALELVLRIYVSGVKNFFFDNSWLAHLFDVVLVVLQILDSLISLTVSNEAGLGNLGVLRVLRLFRVARMVRLVRLVPELRSMVFLIGASLRTFVWAAVLMLLIMYCLAVYFTIIASGAEVSDSEAHLVKLYWGSIGGSVLSLLMAVAGGADWHQFLLVFGQGSWLYIINSFLLSIYVGFAILVMLNLVTGVLAEGAQNIIRSDKETALVRMAAQIFMTAGQDSDSEMTKKEFEKLSCSPAMNKYCHEVGMTLDEALDLAELRLWSKDKSQDTLGAIRSLHVIVSQLAYNQTLLFASAGQASEHPPEKALHIEEVSLAQRASCLPLRRIDFEATATRQDVSQRATKQNSTGPSEIEHVNVSRRLERVQELSQCAVGRLHRAGLLANATQTAMRNFAVELAALEMQREMQKEKKLRALLRLFPILGRLAVTGTLIASAMAAAAFVEVAELNTSWVEVNAFKTLKEAGGTPFSALGFVIECQPSDYRPGETKEEIASKLETLFGLRITAEALQVGGAQSGGSLAVEVDSEAKSSHWQIERAELRQLLGEVLQQEFRELSAKLIKETLPEEFRRLAATCFNADGPACSPGGCRGKCGALRASGGPNADLPYTFSTLITQEPDASLGSDPDWDSMRLDTTPSEAISLGHSADDLWRDDVSNAPSLLAHELVLQSSEAKRQEALSVQTRSKGKKTTLDASLQKHLDAVHKPDKIQDKGFRRLARRMVKAACFDYCISLVLVLNAVSIGVQAERQATLGSTPEGNAYFQAIEGSFGVIFAIELGLRVYVNGFKHFFFGKAMCEHLFDFVLVFLQLVDIIVALSISSEAGFNSLGFLRILRLFRLARMVRLVRLVPELRSMVYLISASLSAFVWAAVLMLLIMYCLAVYFTIVASEADVSDSEEHFAQLYWGSIGGSVLSLFMAVAGGADWHQFLLVFGQGSSLYIINSFLLSIYVGFAILVMLNLVTGVLVEGAQNIIRSQKETELAQMSAEIFVKADTNNDSEMSKDEFDKLMCTPSMDTYCHAIGMTLDEAANLFEFLDRDDSGSISIAEFVQGCLRLRGPAKALDLAELRLWSKDNSQDTLKSIKSLHAIVSQLAYNQALLFRSASSESSLGMDLHIEEHRRAGVLV